MARDIQVENSEHAKGIHTAYYGVGPDKAEDGSAIRLGKSVFFRGKLVGGDPGKEVQDRLKKSKII